MTDAHDPAQHRLPASLLVACGVAVIAVLAIVAALALSGGGHDGRTYRYVIPAGTGARVDAGETPELVPSRLVVHVGDRLVIRNEDTRAQHMGPLVVDANSVLKMRFARAGTIEGVCTLNDTGRAKIVIRD